MIGKFPFYSTRLGIVILCLLLAGCAATVPPPALPDPDMDWSAVADLPEPIRTSLQESTTLFVASEGGVDIPVRLFGSTGTRSPVLMVHGLQSHSGWFSQSAAFIAGLGHPVYVVDRRGSGLSQALRGDSKDFMEWADDIQAVAARAIEKHGHQQLIILGHCFGAIPATVYAETYPGIVRGLILTSPAIYTHTSVTAAQGITLAFTSPGRRNFYFPVPLDPNQFSELPEYEPFIAGDPLALRKVTGDLYWQIHEARIYIQENTARLTMPVWAGMAGEDEIADNRKNQRWLKKVPAEDKTEITYSDARHVLEFSLEREGYFQDLANWLTRIEER